MCQAKMIPSLRTPSPRQPPSDIRAGRGPSKRSGHRGPPAMAGPFFCLRLTEVPMHSPAAELSRRLAENAEAVCRHYLSNGRRQGHYWIVGDVQNAPGRSMYVRLSGPANGSGAAGKWTDAQSGLHGDLLDIIRESCGLHDFKDVAEEARRFLSLPPPEPSLPTAARLQAPVPVGSTEAARRLFAMGSPICGTPAESYLRRPQDQSVRSGAELAVPSNVLLSVRERRASAPASGDARCDHRSGWPSDRDTSHLAATGWDRQGGCRDTEAGYGRATRPWGAVRLG